MRILQPDIVPLETYRFMRDINTTFVPQIFHISNVKVDGGHTALPLGE
jgi:hypothetical protein